MDVRGLLRSNGSDEAIAGVIRENIRAKWMGHQIGATQFVPPPRPMYSIGG
jgi:cyclic pyranopterin phosphate synthase